ncbi:related to Actin-related protein 2/3 complex subunit 5 [Saccharomycodes ludwigii]|uniref:Actin-related protein 2/3 complex subunit 5 n=1 Tax=Saccharomycodes ludwigii TaxID=36035 RepID=A0A376B7S0_9ASCO|nr:hypothetical protein SCDLUD_000336 [Saccharomycodes ludwigii]KAH3902748.1 hypothetical protein SCDLUD_000336 [Saccharomycodes ludwigii]SSD60708.1 related to Actin-related protein 2/3 complex subunit 5 [Saccharomycodes ludwigii]
MEDWRRIDIDALDPENARLTAADLQQPLLTTLPTYTIQQVQQQISQLRSFGSSGDTLSAVRLITGSPVYLTDSEATKQQYLLAVLDVLCQARPTDIANIVKQLSNDEADVLTKYLYKGMSKPEGAKQGAVLLSWLDKVIEKNGTGSIIRFLTDRKSV